MGEENKAIAGKREIVELTGKDAAGSSDMFWKVVVVALFVVIVFQTALLYKSRSARPVDNSTVRGDVATKPERQRPVVLKPRSGGLQATTSSQRASGISAGGQGALTPPPLPHLSVNVNPKHGGAPVISASQPQLRQVPSYQSFTARQPGGMSIHISQFPATAFGPSFEMDIQNEIARMERMMNAMMKLPMMRLGPGSTHFPVLAGMMSRGGGGNPLSLDVSSPAVKEEKGDYIVRLDVPGLDKTQVDARVRGQMLVVSGTRREEAKKQGRGFQSYSSSLSSFHNSFPLPGPVKSEGLKVEYDKGTLIVRVPKKR